MAFQMGNCDKDALDEGMTNSFFALLGLEIIAFPNQDDVAPNVIPAADLYQQEALTVPPLQRPSIQPYLGFQYNTMVFAVAPAISSFKGQTANDLAVQALAWRIDARLWWLPASWVLGGSIAYADAQLKVDDTVVAEAFPELVFEPTMGQYLKIRDTIRVVGRARLPIMLQSEHVQLGFGGALSIEFTR